MQPIRNTLAQSAFLKAVYHRLYLVIVSSVSHISPGFLQRFRYLLAWGRWPDLKRPRTFDEKLQWLNLFWQHPLKVRCGDKFTMRGFVEEQRLGHLLPKLFSVYSSSEEIRLETLPNRFVLKCSNGCKCNVFCIDKRVLDWKTAKTNLDSWMKMNFAVLGELHYAMMRPRIICEEFLQDETGRFLPTDYKIFCFAGRAYCTMVATAREPNGIPRLAFYDIEWKQRLPYCVPELAADQEIQRPAAYEEMIDCAQKLSRMFPFVRMDFYSINGKAKLGEMTFTPGACVSADYMTTLAQHELGILMELPERLTQTHQ